MEICRNGALRQDYGIFRRSDGKRVAVVYTTSSKQAVTFYLKSHNKDCHDGERSKYVAHSMSSDMERQQFVARQEPVKKWAYYKHHKIMPPPPPVIGWNT